MYLNPFHLFVIFLLLVSCIRFYNNINVCYSVVGGKLLDLSILLFYFPVANCTFIRWHISILVSQLDFRSPGYLDHFHSAGDKVYNEFIDMYR